MRAADLRQLQPFITAVEGYAAALARDTSECRCSLNAVGHWEPPTTGCVGERGCRLVLHIVVRAHLGQLRMPVDHLTDPELDEAVEQLHGLTVRAAQLSPEEFAGDIKAALHDERVAHPA
ncbi:hypothetical protein [Blastococcus sp. CT_GayMR16]|uniref:hypothetical protein n=1 Tax=Blastococcus sp. CT_GayMR16 TaxID=2559607 RepID=UPI0010732530|nr:hypothetical protein [Blastococcus sp. CT_GayMR16]TFV83146.1 hypothetical protein E4P38_21050 [Blastococcus sp. CT_GayMR16]